MSTTMLFITGVLFLLIGIIVSIGLHEIGHLVPAKKFGVRVPQYMIGFGPTIFSFTRGETEYGIKLIPLGGYISMVGMYPPLSDSEKQILETEQYNKENKVKVKRSLKEKIKHKWLLSSLDAREHVDNEITENDENRTFYNLATWKKLIVMISGPLMNGVLAFGLVAGVITIHGINEPINELGSVDECLKIEYSEDELVCTDADIPGPAYEAGLRVGDTIIEYDDIEINEWEDLSSIIRSNPGKNQEIVYERDGEVHNTYVTPLATERPIFDSLTGRPLTDDDDNVITETVGFIGVSSKVELVKQHPLEAGPMIWEQIERVAEVVVVLPARIYDVAESTFVEEVERDPEGPVSVVGVGRIAGEINTQQEVPVESRIASILYTIAAVNIALMLLNMIIPLTPLDGGHIAGALLELLRKLWAKLRKKEDPGPIDTSKIMPITYVMVTFLLLTGAILILADFVNPISIFDDY